MVIYILSQFFMFIILLILWYVVVMNVIGLVQMFIALFISTRYKRKSRQQEYKLMGGSANMVPISVLVPAFNEEGTVVDTIKSLLNLNYSNYEIIVINDGSSDKTFQKIVDAFGLHKITYPVRERLATKKVRGIYYNPDIHKLHLVDKENGGKSDTLNAGINLSNFPYIVSIDADSLLDPNALLHIAMAFMQNKYNVAVGGSIRVANGCEIQDGKILEFRLPRKILPLFQTLEYLLSFLTVRIGRSGFNSLFVISGDFGAFQKEAVLSVGGYSQGNMGEDMDLVIKLHQYMRSKKYKYRMSFLPEAICWINAPEKYGELYVQRRRWQMGLIDVLNKYRKLFLNPSYGLLGLLSMPYYYIFERFSPVMELLGIILIPLAWFFGFLPPAAVALFFMALFVFGIVTTTGTLLVEELNTANIKFRGLIILSALIIPANFFYRPMTVIFRLIGIFSYYKKGRKK